MANRRNDAYANVRPAALAQAGITEGIDEGEDHPVNNILAREAMGGRIGLAGREIYGEPAHFATGEVVVPFRYRKPSE